MEDYLGEHLLIGYLTEYGYCKMNLDLHQGFGNQRYLIFLVLTHQECKLD